MLCSIPTGRMGFSIHYLFPDYSRVRLKMLARKFVAETTVSGRLVRGPERAPKRTDNHPRGLTLASKAILPGSRSISGASDKYDLLS